MLSTPASTAARQLSGSWQWTAIRPPTSRTRRATSAMVAAGTGSVQSPISLAQPVAAAWRAASSGSRATGTWRPPPTKKPPSGASQRPACQARGRPGSVPNQGGGSPASPGERMAVTPARRWRSTSSRSVASENGRSGRSAPGWVWTLTSPGMIQPSATTSAPGTGSVVQRSPSAYSSTGVASGSA
jgi:hypothetical protein